WRRSSSTPSRTTPTCLQCVRGLKPSAKGVRSTQGSAATQPTSREFSPVLPTEARALPGPPLEPAVPDASKRITAAAGDLEQEGGGSPGNQGFPRGQVVEVGH